METSNPKGGGSFLWIIMAIAILAFAAYAFLTGDVQLVIAGESADFEFTLDPLFCEQFDVEVGN